MRKASVRDAGRQLAVKVDPRSEAALEADVEPSRAQPRTPDGVPAVWLDRLLVATLDLPLFRSAARYSSNQAASASSIASTTPTLSSPTRTQARSDLWVDVPGRQWPMTLQNFRS